MDGRSAKQRFENALRNQLFGVYTSCEMDKQSPVYAHCGNQTEEVAENMLMYKCLIDISKLSCEYWIQYKHCMFKYASGNASVNNQIETG